MVMATAAPASRTKIAAAANSNLLTSLNSLRKKPGTGTDPGFLLVQRDADLKLGGLMIYYLNNPGKLYPS